VYRSTGRRGGAAAARWHPRELHPMNDRSERTADFGPEDPYGIAARAQAAEPCARRPVHARAPARAA